MNTQSNPVDELYKSVGALFLAKSKFSANVRIKSSYLNDPSFEKHITAELTHNVTKLIVDKFAKQIERTEIAENQIDYKLSFFAFTSVEFKLMVNYIISQLPESEISKIRGNNQLTNQNSNQ